MSGTATTLRYRTLVSTDLAGSVNLEETGSLGHRVQIPMSVDDLNTFLGWYRPVGSHGPTGHFNSAGTGLSGEDFFSMMSNSLNSSFNDIDGVLNGLNFSSAVLDANTDARVRHDGEVSANDIIMAYVLFKCYGSSAAPTANVIFNLQDAHAMLTTSGLTQSILASFNAEEAKSGTPGASAVDAMFKDLLAADPMRFFTAAGSQIPGIFEVAANTDANGSWQLVENDVLEMRVQFNFVNAVTRRGIRDATGAVDGGDISDADVVVIPAGSKFIVRLQVIAKDTPSGSAAKAAARATATADDLAADAISAARGLANAVTALEAAEQAAAAAAAQTVAAQAAYTRSVSENAAHATAAANAVAASQAAQVALAQAKANGSTEESVAALQAAAVAASAVASQATAIANAASAKIMNMQTAANNAAQALTQAQMAVALAKARLASAQAAASAATLAAANAGSAASAVANAAIAAQADPSILADAQNAAANSTAAASAATERRVAADSAATTSAAAVIAATTAYSNAVLALNSDLTLGASVGQIQIDKAAAEARATVLANAMAKANADAVAALQAENDELAAWMAASNLSSQAATLAAASAAANLTRANSVLATATAGEAAAQASLTVAQNNATTASNNLAAAIQSGAAPSEWQRNGGSDVGNYSVGDVVSYGSNNYICILYGGNYPSPPEDPTYWAVLTAEEAAAGLATRIATANTTLDAANAAVVSAQSLLASSEASLAVATTNQVAAAAAAGQATSNVSSTATTYSAHVLSARVNIAEKKEQNDAKLLQLNISTKAAAINTAAAALSAASAAFTASETPATMAALANAQSAYLAAQNNANNDANASAIFLNAASSQYIANLTNATAALVTNLTNAIVQNNAAVSDAQAAEQAVLVANDNLNSAISTAAPSGRISELTRVAVLAGNRRTQANSNLVTKAAVLSTAQTAAAADTNVASIISVSGLLQSNASSAAVSNALVNDVLSAYVFANNTQIANLAYLENLAVLRSALTGTYIGAWNQSDATYTSGNMVMYGGNLYYCKQYTGGYENPASLGLKWFLVGPYSTDVTAAVQIAYQTAADRQVECQYTLKNHCDILSAAYSAAVADPVAKATLQNNMAIVSNIKGNIYNLAEVLKVAQTAAAAINQATTVARANYSMADQTLETNILNLAPISTIRANNDFVQSTSAILADYVSRQTFAQSTLAKAQSDFSAAAMVNLKTASTLSMSTMNMSTSVANFIVVNAPKTTLEITSGLQLWLDASDSTTLTLSGSNVTGWADKSGNGNNSVPKIAGTVSLSNGVLRGGYMNINTVPQNPTVQSIFFVCSTDTNGGIVFPQGEFGQYLYLNYGRMNLGAWSYSQCFQGNTPIPLNTNFMYDFTFQPGSVAGYLNGSSDGSNANTFTSLNHQNKGISFGAKTMSEIIIFNRYVSTTERQQIEGYLAWKWNLQGNLPSSHPFYSASPIFMASAIQAASVKSAQYNPLTLELLDAQTETEIVKRKLVEAQIVATNSLHMSAFGGVVSRPPIASGCLVYLNALNYSGSGPWLDETGNGQNATIENGRAAKNSAGNAIVFDGSTNWLLPYIHIGNYWSASVWFKQTARAVGPQNGFTGVLTQIYNNNTVNLHMSVDATSFSSGFFANYENGSSSGNIAIPLNRWVNMQVTWDGVSMSSYVNGMLVGRVQPDAVSSTAGQMPYRIGGSWTVLGDPVPLTYFVGEIGSVAIFDRPLSAEEVYETFTTTSPSYVPVTIAPEIRAVFNNVSSLNASYSRAHFKLDSALSTVKANPSSVPILEVAASRASAAASGLSSMQLLTTLNNYKAAASNLSGVAAVAAAALAIVGSNAPSYFSLAADANSAAAAATATAAAVTQAMANLYVIPFAPAVYNAANTASLITDANKTAKNLVLQRGLVSTLYVANPGPSTLVAVEQNQSSIIGDPMALQMLNSASLQAEYVAAALSGNSSLVSTSAAAIKADAFVNMMTLSGFVPYAGGYTLASNYRPYFVSEGVSIDAGSLTILPTNYGLYSSRVPYKLGALVNYPSVSSSQYVNLYTDASGFLVGSDPSTFSYLWMNVDGSSVFNPSTDLQLNLYSAPTGTDATGRFLIPSGLNNPLVSPTLLNGFVAFGNGFTMPTTLVNYSFSASMVAVFADTVLSNPAAVFYIRGGKTALNAANAAATAYVASLATSGFVPNSVDPNGSLLVTSYVPSVATVPTVSILDGSPNTFSAGSTTVQLVNSGAYNASTVYALGAVVSYSGSKYLYIGGPNRDSSPQPAGAVPGVSSVWYAVTLITTPPPYLSWTYNSSADLRLFPQSISGNTILWKNDAVAVPSLTALVDSKTLNGFNLFGTGINDSTWVSSFSYGYVDSVLCFETTMNVPLVNDVTKTFYIKNALQLFTSIVADAVAAAATPANAIVAFNVASVSSLSCWLDAADPTTFTIDSNVNILQWSDKSGMSTNALCGNVNNPAGRTTPPTIGSNLQNGRSVVMLNQSRGGFYANSFFYSPFSTPYVGREFSMFTVFNTYSHVGNNQVIFDLGLYITTGNPCFQGNGWPNYNLATTGVANSGNVTLLDNSTYVQLGFVQTSNSLDVYMNGSNFYTYNGTTNELNIKALILGNRMDPYNPTNYSNLFGFGPDANYAEVLTFNRAVTVTERQNLEGHLAWKWGIQSNLSGSNPYVPVTLASQGLTTNSNGVVVVNQELLPSTINVGDVITIGTSQTTFTVGTPSSWSSTINYSLGNTVQLSPYIETVVCVVCSPNAYNAHPIGIASNGGFTRILNSTPLDNGNIQAIAYNGYQWIAVGTNYNGNVMMRSTDMSNWTNVPNLPFTYSGFSVAWNGNHWLAGGNNTSDVYVSAKSTDGVNWTSSTHPLRRALIWTGSNWMDHTFKRSIDGLTWTTPSPTPTNVGINIVKLVNNGYYYLACGNKITNNNVIAKSYDGITWTLANNSMNAIGVSDIAWNGSLWMCCYNTGVGGSSVATSSDGLNWTVATNSGVNCSRVDWNGREWVIGRTSGYCTTVDAITFSATVNCQTDFPIIVALRNLSKPLGSTYLSLVSSDAAHQTTSTIGISPSSDMTLWKIF